jgi:hypothetical protein
LLRRLVMDGSWRNGDPHRCNRHAHSTAGIALAT